MPLKINVTKKEPGVFVVFPIGSIDTETHGELNRAIKEVLDSSTKAIIINMEKVDYISSMGLSVIFKTKKTLEDNKGTLLITNLQPNIKKVFDAVKVIPSWIFETMQEADDYLDAFLASTQKE